MEQTTHPLQHSRKSVRNLDDLFGVNQYIFPKTIANECDPATGEAAVFVQTGGKKFYLICGKVIEIEYIVYCVLKDSGFNPEQYAINGESDPLYDKR